MSYSLALNACDSIISSGVRVRARLFRKNFGLSRSWSLALTRTWVATFDRAYEWVAAAAKLRKEWFTKKAKSHIPSRPSGSDELVGKQGHACGCVGQGAALRRALTVAEATHSRHVKRFNLKMDEMNAVLADLKEHRIKLDAQIAEHREELRREFFEAETEVKNVIGIINLPKDDKYGNRVRFSGTYTFAHDIAFKKILLLLRVGNEGLGQHYAYSTHQEFKDIIRHKMIEQQKPFIFKGNKIVVTEGLIEVLMRYYQRMLSFDDARGIGCYDDLLVIRHMRTEIPIIFNLLYSYVTGRRFGSLDYKLPTN